eukprot:GILJ01003574.1.p1 GENE.GILJ01003574.1~~GILJ01003574.1.p1  ORF type:complete len:460 (+),score=63.69 GILJ01003574.1:43-1380(+)
MGVCASSDSSESPLLRAVRLAARGELRTFVDVVTRYQLRLDWYLPRYEGVSKNELSNAEDGPTLLIIAANEGHKGVVEWMMNSPSLSSFIDASERFGGMRTALYCAAERGFLPIVETLLAHGADPNKGTTKNGFPLHIAARMGNVEICKLLVQHKANVDAVTEDGRTALTTASFYGQHKTVDFLLAAGASIGMLMGTEGQLGREVVGGVTGLGASGGTKTNMDEGSPVVRTGGQQPLGQTAANVPTLSQAEQEAMQRVMMERGMAVSRSLSARIAKLALLQEPKDSGRQLISRAALEQTLYDTISCHAVVFYLATEDECAASAYQMQLSDFLLSLLVPFLDEDEVMIADEIKRGSFAFIKKQEDAAEKDAVLRQQLQATERQIAALNRQTLVMQTSAHHSTVNTSSPTPSPGQGNPPKEGDWNKRFNQASAVFTATRAALSLIRL